MKYTPAEQMPRFFRLFWRHYPRKIGRGAALKSWDAQGLEEHGEMIVNAVKKYPFADEVKFIPHPSTFLNQWRWEDTFEEESSNEW